MMIRIGSALAAVAIVFLVVYSERPELVYITLALIAVLSVHELGKLIFPRITKGHFVAITFFLLILAAAFDYSPISALGVLFGFATIEMLQIIFKYRKYEEDNIVSIVFPALAFVYIVFPLYTVGKIFELSQKFDLFVLLLFSVWASDIFAYFTGTFLGKTKLAEELSPKKTVEGAIGGLVGALIINGLFYKLVYFRLPLIFVIVMSVVIWASSLAGDLFASWLKRRSKAKDSGTFLPGHGGVLDRIDSLLFSSPLLLLAYQVILKYL